MSKVSSPPILNKESMPDAPEGEWLDKILDYGNGFNDQVAKALRNGVTLSDNTPYKTQSYILKHGVETEITPPLAKGLSIKGVSVLQCEGIEVDATTLKPTGKVTSLGLGSPLVWRPSGKESGSIYVTANYDLQHTQPSLIKYKTSDQLIAPGINNTITWDTSLRSTGTAISESAGTFTINESGLYQCLMTVWLQDATYSDIRPRFIALPSGTFIGGLLLNLAFGVLPIVQASFIYPFEAAQSFVAQVYQQNGAAANRNIISGIGSTRISVARIFNDSLPFGRLNLLFYGE